MHRSILVFIALTMAVSFAGCAAATRPLTGDQIQERATGDLLEMFAQQEPIRGTVTLAEAMARAVRYNLDHRLKLMESALASRQFDVARYEQLPRLTVAAGYEGRNNYSGSSSQALTGPSAGAESLVSSTSQEREILTGDISMMWNVLDFGVSYLRARQQADRVLILEERRRKVIQNIIQDVRRAYWRAVTAEVLLKEMTDLLKQARTALEQSEKILAQRLKPPRELLEYQRTLLENIRLIWALIQQLTPAKTELAALMNLRPGTEYRLAAPTWGVPVLSVLEKAPAELAQVALENRPELREEDFRSRISALDVRRSIVELLPGLRFDVGSRYDSNDFLYNNDWWKAGAHISMNLFSLISGPAAYRNAKTQEKVGILRRQALSLAVMTQVHLSVQSYGLAREEYLLARRLDQVNQRLHLQMTTAEAAGQLDDLAVIRNASLALVARMRHYRAFADLQNAAGRIYHSLGMDPLPQALESMELGALTRALEERFSRMEQLETEAEPMGLTPVPSPVAKPPSSRPPAEVPKPASVSGSNPPAAAPVGGDNDAETENGPPPATVAVPNKAAIAPMARRLALVIGDRVNLRKGPALTEIVIAQIPLKGVAVDVLDHHDNWFQVQSGDNRGWMMEDYLLLRPADSTPLALADTGTVNAERVNIRQAPTVGSAVQSMIDSVGLPVQILERRDNWLRIDPGDQTGWVYGLFVNADPAENAAAPAWGSVNAYRVNLRQGPGASFAVKANIGNRRLRVRILDFQDRWFQVLAGSIPGWIHQDLLEVDR
ncbi:MAG: TolC family protein [Desulfatibacillum sp.]|nr:TolC family protein [Desulfatibacillum sp.]